MPAVRMLFLMMSTPTSEYFGMMTGRTILGLLRTTCEPVVRSCVKTSASKIRTSVRQSAGASLFTRYKRKRDVNQVPIVHGLRVRVRLESAALEHSVQGPARKAGFDEQLQCLGEVVESGFFAGTLAVDIEWRTEGNETVSILSHLRGNGQLEPDSVRHAIALHFIGQKYAVFMLVSLACQSHDRAIVPGTSAGLVALCSTAVHDLSSTWRGQRHPPTIACVCKRGGSI